MKTLSKIAFGLGFFALAIVISGCSTTATVLEDGKNVSPVGKVYYTRTNIWFETPENIRSTNYHKGEMVPAGSQVEILKLKKCETRFRDIKTGIEFKLIQIRKYTDIT